MCSYQENEQYNVAFIEQKLIITIVHDVTMSQSLATLYKPIFFLCYFLGFASSYFHFFHLPWLLTTTLF